MKRAISLLLIASLLTICMHAQTTPPPKPNPAPSTSPPPKPSPAPATKPATAAKPGTAPAPAKVEAIAPEKDTKRFAVGIFLGFPMGFTAKFDLAPNQALETKAAWDLLGSVISDSDSPMFVVHLNYIVWIPKVLVLAKTVDIPPFAGIGAEMRFEDGGFLMGIHIPFGLMHRFSNFPLELSLEGNLGIGLYPATTLLYSGGLAVRFRF